MPALNGNINITVARAEAQVAPSVVTMLVLSCLTVRLLSRFYSAVSMLYLYWQTNIGQTALDQGNFNVVAQHHRLCLKLFVAQYWKFLGILVSIHHWPHSIELRYFSTLSHNIMKSCKLKK